MKRVELYGRVRHAVMIEGLSQREAARCFGIDPRTVRKMLSYSVPPGYVRTRPPVRPKLDPFIGIIDRILEEDKDRPKKQRHTSKRIFERLRDEYGFTGKITIVKDYICGVRQRRREMFVPLTHPPGHAQVDFGEALAVIGGVERKIHFLAMSLPHSDACFVKAYPGETTEAFCDGHVSGFSFFGGVPRSILYDNTRIAVARILGDGKRQRTRVFSELRSHYLFEDRFGRPGKGNDKGKVEGIVGYCRRNFLVPMPRFRNFDDLNTHLEACCAKRWAEQLRGHDQTVGERLERDRAVLQRLPAIAYDACDKRPGRVSSLSLVRYRGTDYSVPTRFGHCEVLVRGYVHEVHQLRRRGDCQAPAFIRRIFEACCAKRWAEQLRGHDQTVGGDAWNGIVRFFRRLPAIAYDACDKRPGRVSSLSLVRYLAAPITPSPHGSANLRGAGPRLCPRGGHQLRRARGLRLRSAALSVLAGAKDQRAGSGGSRGRLAVAAGVRRSPPPT